MKHPPPAGSQLLSERDGKSYLEDLRNEPWATTDAPLMWILVSEREYTGQVDPVWLPLDHIAPGTASVYPVKARTTDGGMGQWRYTEVLAVAITEAGLFWRRRVDNPGPPSAVTGWL